MQQSSTIVFYLLAGFIIFITMRGELPKYAAAVGIGASGTGTTSDAASNMGATNSEEKAYESLITQ